MGKRGEILHILEGKEGRGRGKPSSPRALEGKNKKDVTVVERKEKLTLRTLQVLKRRKREKGEGTSPPVEGGKGE